MLPKTTSVCRRAEFAADLGARGLQDTQNPRNHTIARHTGQESSCARPTRRQGLMKGKDKRDNVSEFSTGVKALQTEADTWSFVCRLRRIESVLEDESNLLGSYHQSKRLRQRHSETWDMLWPTRQFQKGGKRSQSCPSVRAKGGCEGQFRRRVVKGGL